MVTEGDWRVKQIRLLKQPLDHENLIKKGLFAKKGAGYRVLKTSKPFPRMYVHKCVKSSGISMARAA